MSHIKAHLMPKQVMTEEEYVEFLLECGKLWRAVLDEYFDEEFASRSHGRQATYMAGCTGPACMTAHRVTTRNSRGGRPSPYSELYEPIIEDFTRQAAEYWTSQLSAMRQACLTQLAKLAITHQGEVAVTPFTRPDGTDGGHEGVNSCPK